MSNDLRGGVPRPIRDASLIEALMRRAEHGRPWLTFHDDAGVTRVNATDVIREAKAWARGFLHSNVTPGARVGIWHPNSADFVAAFFGAHAAGVVPVPLPWPLAEFQHAQARARFEPLLARAGIERIAAPERARDGSDTWVAPLPGADRWESLPTAEDTAFIQFSSGSTGQPRGAVISHRAALANASALVDGLGLDHRDIGVAWIPFFHDMGLIGVLLTSLVGGFEVHVLRPASFLLHPWKWLELVGHTNATLTVAPDFGYAFATRRSGNRSYALKSLRCALSGSEPIHFATLDRFTERFSGSGFDPRAFVGAYGLAENTLGVAAGPALDALHVTSAGKCIPSVGRPLPGTELRVGSGGEILVRSPSLMSGYFNDPAQTALTLRNGWLATGDLGVIEQGQLFIVGREKELIIKGGTKFHPADIEEIISSRVDTPPNGVVAFNTDDDLVVIIEQRRLVDDRDSGGVRALVAEQLGVRIDRVEWVPAGTLPRTTSGKLRRAACAEQFGTVR